MDTQSAHARTRDTRQQATLHRQRALREWAATAAQREEGRRSSRCDAQRGALCFACPRPSAARAAHTRCGRGACFRARHSPAQIRLCVLLLDRSSRDSNTHNRRVALNATQPTASRSLHADIDALHTVDDARRLSVLPLLLATGIDAAPRVSVADRLIGRYSHSPD